MEGVDWWALSTTEMVVLRAHKINIRGSRRGVVCAPLALCEWRRRRRSGGERHT
jgi:hypothetical protein